MTPTVSGRDRRRSAVRALASALPAIILFLPLMHAAGALADAGSELRLFQKNIVDHRWKLNRQFKRVPRKKTEFIIVHTSEGGLNSALRVISQGKVVNGRRLTPGGHAHYVIARSGKTYRTLDRKFVADHAGKSVWNGVSDLSRVSVGIELVGRHDAKITRKQYRSLKLLLDLLQKIYGLEDRQVLTHSQVAYGEPNRWIREDHRGRKRCARNFERSLAGLGPTWGFDPDVRSGRLVADAELAAVYYGGRGAVSAESGSNVVSEENSAWRIAGDDFDDATTLYELPGGTIIPGDRIAATLGWGAIPKGTRVLLNAEAPGGASAEGPVRTIGAGRTAWSLAGAECGEPTTIYIFPDGVIKTGRQISDWSGLPADTRLIVGYRGPYGIGRDKPPLRIAGSRYDDGDTVYLFPDGSLCTGDRIGDFTSLPEGVKIFLSIDES